MKYLLEHDSVHGRFKGNIDAADDVLVINGQRITLSRTRDAAAIPWADADVDYVAEVCHARSSEGCTRHR